VAVEGLVDAPEPPAHELHRLACLRVQRGKGLFIYSQTHLLYANEKNQTTRKGASP
jgi:hypothetical protein